MSVQTNLKILLPASRRSRPVTLLTLALALCLSLATPAQAQHLTSTNPTEDSAGTLTRLLNDSISALFALLDSALMIYLLPLTLILMLLGWSFLRHRKNHARNASAPPESLPPEPPRPSAIQPPPLSESNRIARPPALPSNLARAESIQPQPIAPTSGNTTEAVFSIQPTTARKQCPRCHRFFDSRLDACPHDACARPTTVQPASTLLLNNHARNAAHRTQCTQCHRRFENGTRYCYVDGAPLIYDTDEDTINARIFKICRICGQEADVGQTICPNDNTELTLINPGNINRITPTIPLLICSKCRQYAMPGTAYCPNDGELLTPLVDARVTALPASGFGPRRKLCRKCGTRYSGACTYCSQDGTLLTDIH